MQKVSKSNSQEESVGTRELILEAAIRRFAHFGIQKTQLTEIAEDLHISKQSIHHHFPDKQELVQAVADSMRAEYQAAVSTAIQDAHSMLECFHSIIDVRGMFFQKYHLFMFSTMEQEPLQHNAEAHRIKELVRAWEIELLVGRYKEFIAKGELKDADAHNNISLIMDMLMAYNHTARDAWKVRDRDLISQMLEKQKQVIELVYNGIAITNTKGKKLIQPIANK